VFIRRSSTEFYIISIYVDDLNIIGHTKGIDEARNLLKTEFEMKDLGRTQFFLGLQLEHLQMVFSYTSPLRSIRYWKSSIWIRPMRLELLCCLCLREKY
jgi:hypothetical protein